MIGYIETAFLGVTIVILLYLIRIMIYRIANMPMQEKMATQDLIESVLLAISIGIIMGALDVSFGESASQQLQDLQRELNEIVGITTLGSPEAGTTYIDRMIQYFRVYRELIINIKDQATQAYDRQINRFAGVDISLYGFSLKMFERLSEQFQGKDRIAAELSKLGYIIKASFAIIVNLSIIIVALEYLKSMAALLLITGIVLRAFYLTKGLGSILISFSISFYVIFPTIVSMFLTNEFSKEYIGIQGTELKVDGVSYRSATLMRFDLEKYSRATDSVKDFLNFLYNRLNIGIWLALGMSLGIAFYIYGILTGGSLIWGAPMQFLRLL
ncbi:MAG: hypothetical protein N3C61_01265 [Candidatus Micrarchaeota archaeon]|nr:hypothetical protein [Candidatus Micrarchaeota archaeon]